ncbi:ADP-ribosylglycohydrolase family protein [Lutibacter sp.]|uniref:ADP-ribosylglycohydrolase family protein n=1 Tax=Lutibacter sp. TaxID=1925666 RepID=UPI0034A0AD04
MNFQKIKNSIYGFIIGDALGVPFEFKAPAVSKIDMIGFGTHNQPLGTWSDDSSLMLATLDSISNNKDLRECMVNWVKYGRYAIDNLVFDIGHSTKTGLINNKINKDFYSNGNGSLMRMLPFVFELYGSNQEKIKEVVIKSSSITHVHEISINACMDYINYFHNIINGLNKEKSLPRHLIYILSKENFNTKGFVIGTLEAALHCFITTNNYTDSIKKAVSLGYDTDTIAAITGSLSGYYYNNVNNSFKNKLRGKEIINPLIDKFVEYIEIK